MNQRITRLVLATALIACSSLAQAQWMWVNEKGVKQLSDQPPPPGTPANRILKSPRGQSPAELRPQAAPTPAEGPMQKYADISMSNVAMLRFKRKLDPLLAQYAAPDAGVIAQRRSAVEQGAAEGAGQ